MKTRRTFALAALSLGPALALLILFFVIPIASTIKTSLLTYDPARAAIPPVTFQNYLAFFTNPLYQSVLFRTVRIALLVTVVLLCVGYPLAFYMVGASSRARSVLTIVILSPLLVSVIARSYAWLVILSPSGLVNRLLLAAGLIEKPLKMMYTEGAIVVGLAYVLLPYMVLSIDAALRLVDPRLESAARSLGASPPAAFLKITLPLSMPGVVSGSVIVFALSASAFVTPAMLGGSSNKVVASVLYEQTLVFFNQPFSSAIAISFLILNAVLITLYSRLTAARRTVALAA